MERVFRRYERRKAELGVVDFEDLLERAIRLFEEDESATAEVRSRYRAFTVDEYQDVNLLQQTLLERWLGDRDELCVVGDDHQAIYAFTGATPRYLLEMPHRFAGTAVFRLEENYRSSPEILELANRLVPGLGGSEKALRATRPGGPRPEVKVYPGRDEEIAGVLEALRDLAAQGVAWSEMAVLYRTNAR
jgi:DNA helicase-2/ATP-dependent DNA helicase PcrA